YTFVVGPEIKDTTGVFMDQNNNGVFHELGPAPAGDQFFNKFDIDGLRVLSLSPPTVTDTQGLTAITITFNQAVDPNPTNFTTGNLTLKGPLGNTIPIQSLGHDSTNTMWTLTFAPQNRPGKYTVTVDQNVVDMAGNKMNQNQNSTFGDPPNPPNDPGDTF